MCRNLIKEGRNTLKPMTSQHSFIHVIVFSPRQAKTRPHSGQISQNLEVVGVVVEENQYKCGGGCGNIKNLSRNEINEFLRKEKGS